MAFFLWDKDKQNNTIYDTAKRRVPSGAILFAYMNFIKNEVKLKKNISDVPKNENGLMKLTRMGKSIRHI